MLKRWVARCWFIRLGDTTLLAEGTRFEGELIAAVDMPTTHMSGAATL